ncbi:MAG: hypothetical protein ACREBP_00125 [Sphingomicrobium sp.]
MRIILISLAAAGTALAFATPASAQYYPQPQPGYGQPGYGYGQPQGFHNAWGQMRSLRARIDRVQHEIRVLRDRRMLSRNEYNGLRQDSRNIEHRLRAAGRYGLHHNEVRSIEQRVARLEWKVRREMADGNRWRQGQYGYNDGGYHDRDRDGRNDRYEDDRGRDHD